MTFDISETLAPVSDQLDGIELIAGPRVFQIESVSKGSVEQPVNVHLVGFPRPWRPSKGMRRVLAACWGSDASEWVGRRVKLFYDPEVTFGKDKPGGTRIAALSHIGDKPKSVPLLVSRGKQATFRVQPLPDEPHGLDEFRRETTSNPDTSVDKRVAELRAEWVAADADRRQVIEAEVLRLTSGGAE